jgi:hypothetical protein
LKSLQEECRYPDDLLDHNLGMDRDRINYIAQLPNGPALIQRICDDSQQVIVPKLHDRFGVKDMLEHRTRRRGTGFIALLSWRFNAR